MGKSAQKHDDQLISFLLEETYRDISDNSEIESKRDLWSYFQEKSDKNTILLDHINKSESATFAGQISKNGQYMRFIVNNVCLDIPIGWEGLAIPNETGTKAQVQPLSEVCELLASSVCLLSGRKSESYLIWKNGIPNLCFVYESSLGLGDPKTTRSIIAA